MSATASSARVRAMDWLGQSGPDPASARLWPMLGAAKARRQPAKEFDVLGETLTGWWARRRAKRLDWTRANGIVAAAKGLASYSEAALDEEVKDARSAAVLDREGRAAVDRAFAVGYEAVRREVGLSLHVEQVLGALALASGCCAELATGEGKTVTAILPAALDAWLGRGLHVITVNDYLARRDAEITSPAYRRLGLSVGVIQETTTPEGRRRAYAADITYGADKQILFDYLRDRLRTPLAPRLTELLLNEVAGDQEADAWGAKVVQRGLFAAIVDEADSVLIDDSVTPAIISAPAEGEAAAQEHLVRAAELARQMTEPAHYKVDTRLRKVTMTDEGRARLAELAERLPAFWAGPRRREELMVLALSARHLYHRGEDYVVKDGAVLIVDRSTGRILPGRQWQLGVHQAVEAKEGLKLTAENVAVARSSYQAFFQKYRRLSGMTGTAREVSREMWAWYRLPVVHVPTHRPVIRSKGHDRVHATEEQKLEAAVDCVAEAHAKGQPVLVGTWGVVTSERVGLLLKTRGIDCQVLNATREAEEAAIVAKAGLPGAVTVATNMAGRGTDIVLTPESRAAGGLLVVATERNDEARVDRQLAGRAGRQGDPGAVEQFVCLEDRLIQQHGPRVLVSLVRRNAGPTRRWAAKALWEYAQRVASRRWAVLRSEAVKADAWFEMAMHNVSR
jgi:preprotein translocase subunit SecA